jgi:lipid-binding SYLF domain-containing protein
MKSVISAILLLGVVASAMAVDKVELDYRIRRLESKFEIMQSKPDKRIPAENLRAAQGIVLLDRSKGGFLFAYQGGSGIAIVRDPGSGRWGAPAFYSANEASLGFQIGGEQSFVVILLMNTNTISMLTDGNFKFGGEAGGTAGNSSGRAEGTVSSNEPLVQIYTDKNGLFGGAAIKGDALTPDADANVIYYGQYLTPREILLGRKVAPGPAAVELEQKIQEFAKPK